MNTINKAFLMGRLGKDPDYYSSDKGSVLVLALATSQNYKDKKGEYQTQTDWHQIKVFGKRADAIKEFYKQGDVLHITGRITKETYKDKDGVEKMFPVIYGADIELIEKFKKKSDSPEEHKEKPKTKEESYQKTVAPAMNDTNDDDDDDLPF